jgi:hypothetical protein
MWNAAASTANGELGNGNSTLEAITALANIIQLCAVVPDR